MSANSNPTQAQAILARLEKSPGKWVPMTELWRVSGAFAVHSRVAELRKRGHSIENDVIRADGKSHSFYRLTP